MNYFQLYFFTKKLRSMKDKRGRKPVEEKMRKISVQIYLERYKIDELGGIENAQQLILNFLKSKLKSNGEEKQN